MNKVTNNKEQGFSLVELVMVIVIVSILASVVIVRYVDLKGSAEAPAPTLVEKQVENAFAAYVGKNVATGGYPTVTQLANGVRGMTVSAETNGVKAEMSGSNVLIPTYTDSACQTATTAVADTVKCIGTATS